VTAVDAIHMVMIAFAIGLCIGIIAAVLT